MWSLSKRSRQMSLSHAELEGTLVATEEMQNLSQRLLKVQDEERRSCSNLHDTTGQTLTALKICGRALRSLSVVVDSLIRRSMKSAPCPISCIHPSWMR